MWRASPAGLRENGGCLPASAGQLSSRPLGAQRLFAVNDPHVASLTYAATPSDTASFEMAPPIEASFDGIHLRLEHGQLRIEPNIHFPSIERAREHVDPLLASWEIDVALRFGSPELSFQYQTAEVIDRDPPPPGSPHVIEVESVASATAFGTVTLRVSRGHYPVSIAARIEPPMIALM